MDVYKNAIAMNISRDVAIGFGLVQPTPDERAEMDRRAAEWELRYAADRVVYDAALVRLDGLTEPAVRAVLDLHAPNTERWNVECSHCYEDTEMGDHAEWPCETVATIAGVHGIALPKYGVRSA